MANEVQIRKFESGDIQNKVRWINDIENNKYLHYNLPLEEEKTRAWFEKNRDRQDRFDAVIEYNEIPVGIIGLLSIENGKAEYYITLGENRFKHKGIATRATDLLIDYAFNNLNLQEIYLYTEVDNLPAQSLFEKCGFKKHGIEKNSAVNRGKFVDRYYYSILKDVRK